MTFEVNKHLLVPKHSKLNDKDKEAFLKKFNITIRELPKILQDDPALGKLNAEIGDVIKIERKSRTAGESIYYRVVVEA
ncbi:DNA-directed RNA polymerase subunit H [Candidatus Woesearchaeota archaeon]|nr:hypothetical protein [uncultured archaeon]MBS3123810.1 DNA-directed RNA polymerase subunit H [Candidatus Woesearchaeota archaeon]